MNRTGKFLLLVTASLLLVIAGTYIYFEFIFKMNPFGEFPPGEA